MGFYACFYVQGPWVVHVVLRDAVSLCPLVHFKVLVAPGQSGIPSLIVFCGGTRVTCKMVSDGGGRFIPAGIVGLHTLYFLLASLVAHDRATEDNHTHDTGTVSYTNTTRILRLTRGCST